MKKMIVRFAQPNQDFFKCKSCGRVVRILVRGDRCTCNVCGGTMIRIS